MQLTQAVTFELSWSNITWGDNSAQDESLWSFTRWTDGEHESIDLNTTLELEAGYYYLQSELIQVSAGNAHFSMTIIDSDVPAPGGLALLALAAMGRRCRRRA